MIGADLKRTPWLLLLFAIALLLLLGVAFGAMAGDQTFYDALGRRTGSAHTDSSGSTKFYDAYGRTTGSASTDSNGTTNFYDAFGRRTGSATQRCGPRTCDGRLP